MKLFFLGSYLTKSLSLPSRERGLKQNLQFVHQGNHYVASFAGAWIETSNSSPIGQKMESLPSRERGLKQAYESPKNPNKIVASFAGAWIETDKSKILTLMLPVASFAGAWIETAQTSRISTCA